MQEFIVRDSDEKIIARVRKVLNSDAADKLEGERTLRFTTLLDEGLERLRDEGKYTVEFDNDLYDVVSFQKSMSGNLCFIDISCEHIAYRLNEHKKEYFSQTGTAKEILISMLADTGFVVSDNVPVKTMTYSSQQSATVRAMLLDFAGINGWDVVFHRFTVSVVPHRGSVLDTKILQGNVLEISKTINVTESTAAYSLKLRPKTPVAVGDEVHLVFDRLGIDDKVRVLAIKRQPFISEDITLEVGAYEPTLESESAQVRTDMITENKSYYGTRISAESGLEIYRDDSLAKVVFNADKMAFYPMTFRLRTASSMTAAADSATGVRFLCQPSQGMNGADGYLLNTKAFSRWTLRMAFCILRSGWITQRMLYLQGRIPAAFR